MSTNELTEKSAHSGSCKPWLRRPRQRCYQDPHGRFWGAAGPWLTGNLQGRCDQWTCYGENEVSKCRAHGNLHQERFRAVKGHTLPPKIKFATKHKQNAYKTAKNPCTHNEYKDFWSEWLDSNQRPLEPHSSAIPNFATPGFHFA